MSADERPQLLSIAFAETLNKEQQGRLSYQLSTYYAGFKCDINFAFAIDVEDYYNAHKRLILLQRAEVWKKQAHSLLVALKTLNATSEEEYQRLSDLFTEKALIELHKAASAH